MGYVKLSFEDFAQLIKWHEEDKKKIEQLTGEKNDRHAEGKFAVICEPFLYDSLEDALRMYDIYEKAGLTKYKIYRVVEEDITTKGE